MESPWGEATCNARARMGDGGSDEWAMPCASYLVTAAGRHIVAAFCKLILSLSRALSASMLSFPSPPHKLNRVYRRVYTFKKIVLIFIDSSQRVGIQKGCFPSLPGLTGKGRVLRTNRETATCTARRSLHPRGARKGGH